MGSHVERNGYHFTFQGLNKEACGSLFIEQQDKELVALLKGLTLKVTSSCLPQEAQMTLRADSQSTKHLCIESESIAHAIVTYESEHGSSPALEQALRVLGIEKKAIQPLSPSREEISRICAPLRDQQLSRYIPLINFVLKEKTDEVLAVLQWTERVVRKYPDLKMDLVFLRSSSGKVNFEAWINKELVFPKRSSSPLPPSQRVYALFIPLVDALAVESPHVEIVGGTPGQAFMRLTGPGETVLLSNLYLMKTKDLGKKLPEELLSGHVTFLFRGESFYLGTKSLVSSIKAVSDDDETHLPFVTTALSSIGITPHSVSPPSLDAVAIRQSLQEVGIGSESIDHLIEFLRNSLEELSTRLSWSSSIVRERTDVSKELSFTICCSREGTFETVEIQLPSRREKSLLNKEVFFSTILINKSIPFIRQCLPVLQLHRESIVMKNFPETYPENLASKIHEIHSMNSLARNSAIKNMTSKICCILTALNEMHHQGIYHLALKPEAILFTNDGAPRIANFSSVLISTQERSVYTQPGALDMFSIGMILFDLICDKNPLSDLYSHSPESHMQERESKKTKQPPNPDAAIAQMRTMIQHHAAYGNDPTIKQIASVTYNCLNPHYSKRLDAETALSLLLAYEEIAIPYHAMLEQELERIGKMLPDQ